MATVQKLPIQKPNNMQSMPKQKKTAIQTRVGNFSFRSSALQSNTVHCYSTNARETCKFNRKKHLRFDVLSALILVFSLSHTHRCSFFRRSFILQVDGMIHAKNVPSLATVSATKMQTHNETTNTC